MAYTPYSYEQFSGDGSTDQFAVNMPYLSRDHISVYIDETEDTGFTWVNNSLIQTSSVPSNGATVEVRRVTPKSALTDFTDGSVLGEADLDRVLTQSIYITQESEDNVQSALRYGSDNEFDAGSREIKNVADGTDANDAVNFSQLNAAIVGGNGVPNPADPGDDGKFLQANSGSWSWVTFVKSMITDATSFGLSWLGLADASAGRSNLGSGTTGDALFQDETAADARSTLGLEIDVDVQGYDANTAKTDLNQSWTKSQRATVTTLTSGTNISWNLNDSNDFKITLDTNATLDNPSNATVGQSGVITVTQDGTGGHTLSYGSNFKFVGGTAPVIASGAGEKSTLHYYVESSTSILLSMGLNWS